MNTVSEIIILSLRGPNIVAVNRKVTTVTLTLQSIIIQKNRYTRTRTLNTVEPWNKGLIGDRQYKFSNMTCTLSFIVNLSSFRGSQCYYID